jgi:hypothetical protein
VRAINLDVFSFGTTVSSFVHHERGAGAVAYFLAMPLGLGEHPLILLWLAMLAGTLGLAANLPRINREGRVGRGLLSLIKLRGRDL